MDLEPIQASKRILNIITGQGVLMKSFSNHTKNISNGSKNSSMPWP